MPDPLRCVVTATDADGQSFVLADGAPAKTVEIVPGLRLFEVWEEAALPAPLPARALRTGDAKLVLEPARAGVKYRVFDLPPDRAYLDRIDGDTMFDAIGGDAARARTSGAAHPGMHRTDTIDFIAVLAGEVVLLLDRGEVTLRAGDVLVECGAAHAWSNRTSETARLCAVLVGAREDT
jgi:Cupin domain